MLHQRTKAHQRFLLVRRVQKSLRKYLSKITLQRGQGSPLRKLQKHRKIDVSHFLVVAAFSQLIAWRPGGKTRPYFYQTRRNKLLSVNIWMHSLVLLHKFQYQVFGE